MAIRLLVEGTVLKGLRFLSGLQNLLRHFLQNPIPWRKQKNLIGSPDRTSYGDGHWVDSGLDWANNVASKFKDDYSRYIWAL